MLAFFQRTLELALFSLDDLKVACRCEMEHSCALGAKAALAIFTLFFKVHIVKLGLMVVELRPRHATGRWRVVLAVGRRARELAALVDNRAALGQWIFGVALLARLCIVATARHIVRVRRRC